MSRIYKSRERRDGHDSEVTLRILAADASADRSTERTGLRGSIRHCRLVSGSIPRTEDKEVTEAK